MDSVRSATSSFLAMDETVDALSDEAIKDIWVRQQCFKRKQKVLRRRYQNRPEGMYGSDEFERVMSQLTVGDEDGNFHQFLRTDTDFEVQKAAFQEGDTPAMNLWDYLTKDDMADDEKLEHARARLKHALEGCGVPHIELIRDSVRAWAEVDEVGQHD